MGGRRELFPAGGSDPIGSCKLSSAGPPGSVRAEGSPALLGAGSPSCKHALLIKFLMKIFSLMLTSRSVLYFPYNPAQPCLAPVSFPHRPSLSWLRTNSNRLQVNLFSHPETGHKDRARQSMRYASQQCWLILLETPLFLCLVQLLPETLLVPRPTETHRP